MMISVSMLHWSPTLMDDSIMLRSRVEILLPKCLCSTPPRMIVCNFSFLGFCQLQCRVPFLDLTASILCCDEERNLTVGSRLETTLEPPLRRHDISVLDSSRKISPFLHHSQHCIFHFFSHRFRGNIQGLYPSIHLVRRF
jgi:hypothetical protein